MKKLIKFTLFCTLFLFSCFNLWSGSKKNFEYLDGEWDLYLEKDPYQTFNCINNNIPADFKTIVPGYWNQHLSEGQSPQTYGCYKYKCSGLDPNKQYALLVKDAPKTSCTVYVNRKQVAALGDPFAILKSDYNSQKAETYSFIKPIYCEFYPDSEGNAEIIFFITNYFYRKGGLCDSVMLGTAKNITRLNTLYLIFYTILLGSLVFIGLLNLVQFIINHKRTEYLYLAITAFMFVLRASTYGYCSLAIFFPGLTAGVKIKLEYMALWLAPSAVLQMVFALYPPRHKRVWENILRYVILSCVCALGIFSLVVPAELSNRLVPYLQIAMGVVCTYVVIVGIVNMVARKRYSVYYFMSFFIIIIGGIIDIVASKNRALFSMPVLPFFIVVYQLIQVLLIGVIQNDLYKQTLKKTEELKSLNKAYLRFVPQEFLNLLNKESIVKTKLGDFSNIEMCIMFSKISIKCDSGEENHGVELQEHFEIFNEYLKQVTPIIKKHNGFVSKFLSGGFMALFPKSELDAVKAALEIKDCVEDFNVTLSAKNHKLQAWMGIHFGKMIIGTIGEENRLDDTVISDTVNTSSRLEGVCEKLGKTIIVSQEVMERLGAEQALPFETIRLQDVMVKGKEKPLQIYEVVEK